MFLIDSSENNKKHKPSSNVDDYVAAEPTMTEVIGNSLDNKGHVGRAAAKLVQFDAAWRTSSEAAGANH